MLTLLALSGCGSSGTDAKTTASAGADRSAKLDQAQLASLDRTGRGLVDATVLFLPKLNRCQTSKHRTRCVTAAARPAEAAVIATRKGVAGLRAKVSGDCAAELDTLASALSDLTDDLRPMTVAVSRGLYSLANRVGPSVQTQLRTFAASTQQAQQACARR